MILTPRNLVLLLVLPMLAGPMLVSVFGCQYAKKMKAEVNYYHVGVDITNHNQFDWEECTATLNTDSEKANQYTLNLGTVKAGESTTAITAEFAKGDGKRFIPVITVAKNIRVQCKKPLLPYEEYL